MELSKSSRSTRDLYSSLLVNRLWCKVTIPILWKLPLGQKYNWRNDKKLKKNALCIRTYISCMDTQARTFTYSKWNLESFTSTIGNDYICSLYESMRLICDNILNMDLTLNSYSQVKLLIKLISFQKRLENLSIVVNAYLDLDCNSLFRAIISQKETLNSLRLKSVNLNRVEENSSSIGKFFSLQELSIVGCSGFHKSVCLSLASSFTQLSSFHYSYSRHVTQKYSQEFIITELSLNKLSSGQVIKIFNNNFNELRRFSFDCRREIFDANELLCQMAENVPESLETIEIGMVFSWIFSTNSLRKFFEGGVVKEEEEIKMLFYCGIVVSIDIKKQETFYGIRIIACFVALIIYS
ncbi:10588_t:CDS:2 [Diversispora eburnea]|uniref:10588_t:CDS:1 n=1 Tax=Diversispora eburnea TaxID=1213867 RepID=A0A9N9AC31_9GLOM|nr:10588_t:CDS:2 [Diversispora eburnea]